jgi:hypothetical protein
MTAKIVRFGQHISSDMDGNVVVGRAIFDALNDVAAVMEKHAFEAADAHLVVLVAARRLCDRCPLPDNMMATLAALSKRVEQDTRMEPVKEEKHDDA